jgi:hypothetical protein
MRGSGYMSVAGRPGVVGRALDEPGTDFAQ